MSRAGRWTWRGSMPRWPSSAAAPAPPGPALATPPRGGCGSSCASALGATEFLGYTTEAAEASVTALVVDGQPVERAGEGAQVSVLLNQTPFYAEMRRPGGRRRHDHRARLAHRGHGHPEARRRRVRACRPGRVRARSRWATAVLAELDHARRGAIRAHHSATHLLHEALRRRLGTHVAQKGSLNAPDRLRFDVSQPTPIGRDDLAAVEAEVNARIRENASCDHPPDDPRRGGRAGRDGAVRRKIRRRGARGLDGSGRGQPAGLFGGTVRRHACRADRRHRPVPHHRRERGQRRHPPHRGGDGRGGAGDAGGERPPAGRCGGRAADQPGGIAGAGGRPGR